MAYAKMSGGVVKEAPKPPQKPSNPLNKQREALRRSAGY